MGKTGKKTGEPRYKIPGDEEVFAAIYSAVPRTGVVESQHLFREVVQKELGAMNPAYKIAPKRLRLLAIKSGYITVDIRTREEDRISKKLASCPVCGSKLKKLKNKTIYGGKVTLGYLCGKCSYTTGRIYRRPVRYIFSMHRKGAPAKGAKIDADIFGT